MSDIVNAESRENTRNNAGSSENRNVMNTETIEAVAESYHKTGSFKKTAAELNISTSKVRKALLTAGAWTNETAEEIANLRSEHRDWTDQQIATHLHISLNSVQMYTPYKIGPYDGDGDSKGRMAEYRARNRDKAGEADGNRQEVGSMIGSIIEEKDDKADKAVRDDMVSKDDKASNAGAMPGADSIAGEDPFDLPLNDTSWYEEEQRKAKEQGLPFAAIRHNDDPDAMPYVDDQFFLDYRLVEPAHDWDRHPTVSAMKIRLSVDTGSMSNEELEMIEREYGVKTGWTRELILPSYIPLHFLQKKDSKDVQVEIIVVPCVDAQQAQNLMLQRLYFMEAPDADRDDRWGCDVGFCQKSDRGASQMVCKGNLFVSIITWTDGKENADRMIETMWNSFM